MERKMKDSGIPWIGAIPEEWKVERVANCFFEVISPNIGQAETNTLQFKMGEIISKKGGDSKYNPETIEAYNVVEPGTIMINGLNLSFDLISIRVAQVKEKGAITSTYLALKPKNIINSDFSKYLLKSYDNCKALHAMGRGLRATLSYSTFRNEPIVLPPLSEQSRIAAVLDAKCGEIDELIGVQEEMISELTAYRQAVITEAVTRGLNPNDPLRLTNIPWLGEIPEHWSIERFKSYFATGKGLSITKADLIPSGIPVISYGQVHAKYNMGTGNIEPLYRFVSDKYLDSNQECLMPIGSFIFADTSEDIDGCGNAAYIDCETIVFAGYHAVTAKPIAQKNNKYFAYLFRTKGWRSQIQSKVSGIKVFSISQKIIKNCDLIIPPLSEQEAIAEYLDAKTAEIDELIALKREKIAELKEYRKSLIFEYVTGKRPA